ncbi:hypothetical protein PMAYCL1PPCAC_10186, partial [Pristionchus mayeri]
IFFCLGRRKPLRGKDASRKAHPDELSRLSKGSDSKKSSSTEKEEKKKSKKKKVEKVQCRISQSRKVKT